MTLCIKSSSLWLSRHVPSLHTLSIECTASCAPSSVAQLIPNPSHCSFPTPFIVNCCHCCVDCQLVSRSKLEQCLVSYTRSPLLLLLFPNHSIVLSIFELYHIPSLPHTTIPSAIYKSLFLISIPSDPVVLPSPHSAIFH